MKTHLINILYNKSVYPAVFMAKSFTRGEILDIAKDICSKFNNVYYNELHTTFICKEYENVEKIMRYLIDKYANIRK